MIVVKRKINFVRCERGRKKIVDANAVDTIPTGRVPRISRLMALAIRFERLIREGKVSDMSELARLAYVTQPRMTQIMNLNHLAPDIQEEILSLPCVTEGRERVHERMLRALVSLSDWNEQRRRWKILLQSPRCTSISRDA